MIYEKDTTAIVLRVNNYKGYNFIDEHKNVLNKNGKVTLLKLGRVLAVKSIETVKNSGGFIILKEPKASGGKYYLGKITDIAVGERKPEYLFPEYYLEIEDYEAPLIGTWITIEALAMIPEDYTLYFELDKGGKKMVDIVNCTRSPILFVHCNKSLEFENDFLMEVK